MSDPFSRLAAHMDAITVRKMGKTASINDADMTVIPGETLAELNALSGPAVSLVVFSSGYRPRRGDRVVYDGQQWTVTRHERFNGNLNSLDTRMVPQASAWAINRVAQKAVSVATRQVAGNTVAGDNQVKGIPLKLVRQRVRVFKASPSGKMTARIRVNRGNLPAIKLGTARVRLARRGGKLQYRGSVLKVGKYLFRDAFIQQLANGRWHVMRRIDGKNRYPIDVVKVPLSGPLTQAFEDARDRIIAAEMPKQLGYALKQQLRLWLTR